jgi:hypothetical protein
MNIFYIPLCLIPLIVILVLFRKRIRLWYQLFWIKDKIAEADALKILTGRQQFIIRLNNGKLAIVTSDYINIFNKILKGKRRGMTYQRLYDMSLYHTKA